MLRLTTLGGLSIARPDGPSPSVGATAARRRLSILAVLAASGTRGVPRDTLLALLWPESDTERARHALDQSLYALKRDLGADALVLGREELSLNPAEITSDVADFRALLASGDREAAVAAYTGPFLDGVFISGAPGFERWAEGVRASVTREYEGALEALASSAAAHGDHQGAVQWWQKLAARNPRRTGVVVALMSELAATGDRTEALRQADMYHTLVRDDADVEPNPAVATLADKIKREPAASAPRAAAPPPAAAPAPAAATFAAPAPEPRVTPPPAPRRTGQSGPVESPRRATTTRRVAGAAVIVFVLLAASTALMLWRRPNVDQRVWILPADFDNRTNEAAFDRALDAALVAGLQQSAYVTVLPRERVSRTLARMGRASSGTPMPRLDESLARDIAQREGVRAVLTGAIDRVDSSYVLTANLVDAKSGASLVTEVSRAKRRADVIDAVDDLVRRLRRDIGESSRELAKHDRPLPLVTTSSLEALRRYADGIAESNTGHREAAVELWQQALALDSNFAQVHAELGAAYYFSNDRPRGDAHFTRALSLLDRLTDHEQMIVRAAAESWRGNRERAIELRRVLLAEYPGDYWEWGQIGYDYMRLGRNAEAIQALTRALEQDSTRAPWQINLATAYGNAANPTQALRHYAIAFALQPSWFTVPNINHEYGSQLVLAGRLRDAKAAFDTMLKGGLAQRASGERSLALLSMQQGLYGEAIDHFRRATTVSHAPTYELTEARNRLFLASAEQEKGWSDSARAQLLAAHAMFRQKYFEPTFLLYLGKALLLGGHLPQAEEVLDTLRKRVKDQIPADRSNLLVLSGEVALARGRVDSAVKLVTAGYALDTSAYVRESMARVLAASGDRAGAARLYASLLGDQKNWFGKESQQYGLHASSAAGLLYEQMGDTARARTAYERFVNQWAAPDTDLVSLRAARERLAKLGRASRSLQPEKR